MCSYCQRCSFDSPAQHAQHRVVDCLVTGLLEIQVGKGRGKSLSKSERAAIVRNKFQLKKDEVTLYSPCRLWTCQSRT